MRYDELLTILEQLGELTDAQKAVLHTISAPERPLPESYRSETFRLSVGGHTIYFGVGYYADGKVGEIRLDTAKDGAALRSLLSCFATAVSMGLQHGIPLEKFTREFVHTQFEPSGPVTGFGETFMARSLVDAVFQILEASCSRNTRS